jgi:CRP/FNR family cyclic AMP-dependent transcriptional regulator
MQMTEANIMNQLEPHPIKLLPAIGFLAELDADVRANFAAAGRFVVRHVGDYLSVQQQKHSAMSLILSGRVGITAHAHGDKVDLAVLGAGDVVGEMSVIDPATASATARVVAGPARLWIIDRNAFETFVRDHPEAGVSIIRGLAKGLSRRVRTNSENMLRRAGELRSHFLDMDY